LPARGRLPGDDLGLEPRAYAHAPTQFSSTLLSTWPGRIVTLSVERDNATGKALKREPAQS
jgi:hypothetical protein